jgi:hypothetical protein
MIEFGSPSTASSNEAINSYTIGGCTDSHQYSPFHLLYKRRFLALLAGANGNRFADKLSELLSTRALHFSLNDEDFAMKNMSRFLLTIVMLIGLGGAGWSQNSDGSTAQQSKRVDQLDQVTRAEQRVANLRSQLLDLQTRELNIQDAIEELDHRMTPESIERALAHIGTTRPRDELHNAYRARLERQKERLNRQLELIAANKQRLESSITEMEGEIFRLRQK